MRHLADDERPHVVVVGGGFGGLFAARALRRAPVRVTLVDRNNHHLFQPLLYQVAAASLSPSDIAQPIRAILSRQENARVLLAEVGAIDLARRRVELIDGELAYDYLILAAGTRHAYFGHEEWEASAPGLKSIDDAREIRNRFLTAFEMAEREADRERRRALLTFVIVGGGPTGVELAGTMVEFARKTIRRDYRNFDPRESRVLLLEGGATILPTYPRRLIDKAERSLSKLGVEVRTGAVVTGVDEGGVWVGTERIRSHCVLWAAGNVASPTSRSLGVPLDSYGRVEVEPDLSIPGHPEAFVIGDMALFTHQTGESLPGVAPVAMQQAKAAAGNVRRLVEGHPTEPFRYTDKGNLATIGRAAAVADLRGLHLWGFPAWLAWLVVHIFFLIGFRNRLIVLIQWAWWYFTHQRGARIITCQRAFGSWPRGVRPAAFGELAKQWGSSDGGASATASPPEASRAGVASERGEGRAVTPSRGPA